MITPHTFQAQGHVLTDTHIRELMAQGRLRQRDSINRVQPASIDLALAEGSIWEVAGIPNLTTTFSISTFIKQYAYHRHELTAEGLVLTRGRVYLLPLSLYVDLPDILRGFANPKSTTGRIDVHAILVTEGGREFNVVKPGYSGELYVIVVPQSFPIIVRPGDSLLQLRLFDHTRMFIDGVSVLPQLNDQIGLVDVPEGRLPSFQPEGLLMHLDLETSPSNYLAHPSGRPLDLSVRGTVASNIYFHPKQLDSHGSLFLEPGEFIIASTVERLRIPPYLCGEMVPYDERQGEIRSHYAGFFDPGFGWSAGSTTGSGVVCEIRNIGTAPVILSHNQPICLFRFEYLSDIPETTYGATRAGEASNYQFQSKVTLAKFFAPAKPNDPVAVLTESVSRQPRW